MRVDRKSLRSAGNLASLAFLAILPFTNGVLAAQTPDPTTIQFPVNFRGVKGFRLMTPAVGFVDLKELPPNKVQAMIEAQLKKSNVPILTLDEHAPVIQASLLLSQFKCGDKSKTSYILSFHVLQEADVLNTALKGTLLQTWDGSPLMKTVDTTALPDDVKKELTDAVDRLIRVYAGANSK